MYRSRDIIIRKDHSLYEYCTNSCLAANNLENAVTFRIRQVMTSYDKDVLTPNEQEVRNEIRDALPLMPGCKEPKKSMSYTFIDKLMKATGNPDYYDKRISQQSSQQAIKTVTRRFKGFYNAIKSYTADPTSFTGRPKPPGYHRSGGMCTVTITNQDCVIIQKKHGAEAKLPLTKTRVDIGECKGVLKEVKIKPFHGIFVLSFVFEITDTEKPPRKSSRMISIDEGVNNFAAITNNIGKECLLFKGGVIKAANHRYNKILAKEMSVQMADTMKKFKPTDISNEACIKRDCVINDTLHKIAKQILSWCIDNDIDTIVIGKNRGNKQNANMGHVNNQNFVQIPFYRFDWMIEYLAEAESINVVYQEESYTSKASFLDRDEMPVYGKNDDDARFSGRRICRGLYRAADGTTINADLNGSANILRKAFPQAFDKMPPKFDDVRIIRHPDIEGQLKPSKSPMSKSKQRRIAAKYM